jgi:hypothetical protein
MHLYVTPFLLVAPLSRDIHTAAAKVGPSQSSSLLDGICVVCLLRPKPKFNFQVSNDLTLLWRAKCPSFVTLPLNQRVRISLQALTICLSSLRREEKYSSHSICKA